MKSFLKWAGGKSRLAPILQEYMPLEWNTYIEPFVGSGALFFHMMPNYAILSDANKRLMNTYRKVRDDVEAVIIRLDELQEAYEKDYKNTFYEVKDIFNANSSSKIYTAAQFIFLNKTCFNGLYRENKKGEFNTSIGDYKPFPLYDKQHLRECSKALQNTLLMSWDYKKTMEDAKEGDFVYIDPPYVPLKPTSNFTQYHSGGFGYSDQVALRDECLELKAKGVYVIISNSDTPIVRELYQKFELIEVTDRRSLSGKGSSRGNVKELIIL